MHAVVMLLAHWCAKVACMRKWEDASGEPRSTRATSLIEEDEQLDNVFFALHVHPVNASIRSV
jgi:hypothetical protein